MVKIIWNSVQFCNTAKDCQSFVRIWDQDSSSFRPPQSIKLTPRLGFSNLPVCYGSIWLHLNFCWAFEAFLRSSESSTPLKEEPNVCPDLLSKAIICSFYASPEGTVVLELIRRPMFIKSLAWIIPSSFLVALWPFATLTPFHLVHSKLLTFL